MVEVPLVLLLRLLVVLASLIRVASGIAATDLPGPTGEATPEVAFLLEEGSSLTLSEALERSARFSPAGNRLTLGYRDDGVWFRMAARNPLGQKQAAVLVNPSPAAHSTEVWKVDSTGRTSALLQASGYRFATFAFFLEPWETADLMVRLETHSFVNTRFRIVSQEHFPLWHQRGFLPLAACVGFLLAMMLYNCVLFASLRDPAGLSYILFVGCMIVLYLPMLGICRAWSEHAAHLLCHHLPTVRALPIVTGLYFGYAFLRIGTNHPGLARLLRVLLWLAAGLLIWTMADTNYRIMNTAIDLGNAVSAAALLWASWLAIRLGDRAAVYFGLGWAIFVISVLLWQAYVHRLIPFPEFANAVPVGSTVESLFMSLAIGQRLLKLREDKGQAEARAATAGQVHRLLHVIVHDLANPLSVAIGAVKNWHLLKARDGEAKALWHVESALNVCKEIIAHTRAMRALDTRVSGLRMEDVPLRRVIERLDFLFRERMEAKRLQFQIRCPDREVIVRADFSVLSHEVLGNLLSNAWKYSDTGGRVILSVEVLDDRARFSVIDSGVGIPRRVRAQLLRGMLCESTPGTEGEPGMGLGLELAHAYVNEMKGKLELESATADEACGWVGTRFHVELPLAARTTSP